MTEADRLSIIITERNRLSTVRICLGSILKNSRFKDHEIVFVGDRIDDPVEPWARVGDYKSLREYCEDYWIDKFTNFSLYEVDLNRVAIDGPVHPEHAPAPQGLCPCYEGWNYGIDS